jgi:hypothetical protein
MKLNALPLLFLALSGTAQASLIDRGNGMIYDQDLNITWLQDANYAKTSGYDADGLMVWQAANDWANNLTYGGYSDWRLPTTTDTGTPGCNYANSGTDCGYNVDTSTSELAHLYFDELGNTSYNNSSGLPQTGYGLVNSGPFSNIQAYAYWSGTSTSNTRAWLFYTTLGYQDYDLKAHQLYAWAVRPGDVAPVPVPGAVWLFGSGLIGLVGWKRRGEIG